MPKSDSCIYKYYTPNSSSPSSSFNISSLAFFDFVACLAFGLLEDSTKKKLWSLFMGQPIWKQSGDLKH